MAHPELLFLTFALNLSVNAQAKLIPGKSGTSPMYLRYPIQPVLEGPSFGSGQCWETLLFVGGGSWEEEGAVGWRYGQR